MYDSFLSAMKHLNDSDFRECVLRIRDYALEGVDEESNSPMVNVIMELAKPNLDSARKRYEASVENGKKGAKFGKLGGAPRGNQNARKKQPLNQPPKQPLDEDANVDVEEDVNEDKNVEVKANASSGIQLSFSNSYIGFENKEIENNSERWQEREQMNETLQEVRYYQSNVSNLVAVDEIEELSYSNHNSNNKAVTPYSKNDVECSVAQPCQQKEPGIDLGDYLFSCISNDIGSLVKMKQKGMAFDQVVINRAIDNYMSLYGEHDRKEIFQFILRCVDECIKLTKVECIQ